MSDDLLIFAYESNVSAVVERIKKSKGLMDRFKKVDVKEVVSHVTSAWDRLDKTLQQQDLLCETKVLYTAELTSFSEVKSNATTIVNNSFLLSVISGDNTGNHEAFKNERYVTYSKTSEFEQNQFSIYLSEIEASFDKQEIGVFGWLKIPTDSMATLQKQIAGSFPSDMGGELHFFEFHSDGSIYPNFADVETQRFEGKLAGNYAFKFDVASCKRGIQALNDISKRLFKVEILSLASQEKPKKEAATKSKTVAKPKAKKKAAAKKTTVSTEEVNAAASSAANGKDQDWKEVSERALNWYFNTVRKTDDIHEAEQMFMEEVTSALEDAGIEWNEFPYDISVDSLEEITSSLKKHLGSLKKEFPHFVEGILDPFHTYYDGLLYDYFQNDNLSDEEKNRVEALQESWST